MLNKREKRKVKREKIQCKKWDKAMKKIKTEDKKTFHRITLKKERQKVMSK